MKCRRPLHLALVLTTMAVISFGALPLHSQQCVDCPPPFSLTITQPLSPTVTTFTATPFLTHSVDYTNSGVPASAFTGVSMQSTFQQISDADYANLVAGTPFQNTSCAHQDISTDGTGNFACVVNIDLCFSDANPTPAGANCPQVPGTNPGGIILVKQAFLTDVEPVPHPGYLTGTDTTLTCSPKPGCENLGNIFISIIDNNIDPTFNSGTKNFNSLFVPIENLQYDSSTSSCGGVPSSQVLQPINNPPQDLSVFKGGSTVPVKFQVCEAGIPVTAPSVVVLPGAPFTCSLTQLAGPATVDEAFFSSTPDVTFRSSGQQWIFNLSTKGLQANVRYDCTIQLNDSSTIPFSFALR